MLPLLLDHCEARRREERLKTQSITLTDVGAIFVVLGFGIVGATISFLCEYIAKKMVSRRYKFNIYNAFTKSFNSGFEG